MDDGSILLLAAGVGVSHTLLGPDHYLPVVATARLRGWSGRRALLATAGLGLLHCATTAALVFGAAALSATLLADFQAWRGWIAASVLLVAGLAAWHHRTSQPRTGHTAGLLALAMAVGPCEWLLPTSAAAVAAGNTWQALGIISAFSLATTATMVVAVATGLAATQPDSAPGAAGPRRRSSPAASQSCWDSDRRGRRTTLWRRLAQPDSVGTKLRFLPTSAP